MRLTTSVTGGDKLAGRLQQIMEKYARNKSVLVGLPAGSGTSKDGIPLAVIGAIQEYGSADGHIPERSFLRVPLRQNEDALKGMFRKLMKQVTAGEVTMYSAMDQVGARAAGLSKEAIESGIAPANAPSTIKRKGSATPLVDTGALSQAITHVVED